MIGAWPLKLVFLFPTGLVQHVSTRIAQIGPPVFSWNLVADWQDIFQYDFMRHAFLAGTIIAILAGAVGYFVVLRGLAFASHTLANIGFAGAAGAVLVSIAPVYGLLAFTLVGGLGMGAFGKRLSQRDVAVGIILSLALGLGILFISLYQGYSTDAYAVLFGEVLGISQQDVVIAFVVGAVTLLALGALYRPLLFASLDEDAAEAKGVPIRFIGVAFLLLLALAVAEAVQIVGVLLIFALLVTPAATAERLATRPSTALLLSVMLALLYTWGGLVIAYYLPYSLGFFITTLAFGTYLGVRLVKDGLWRVKRFSLAPQDLSKGGPVMMKIALLFASAPPFSWNLVADVQQMLAVDFMRTAFLSGSIIAITCGLVGYFVLLRHLTFASDALSHVGFAGAMAAAFLGWNPFVGLFGGSIIIGIGMGQLGRNSTRSRDIAVGTVLAWMLGLGALFLGLYLAHPAANPNIAVGVGVLFGSIFGVDAPTALIISAVGVATSLALLAIARPLLFASLDPEVAQARGLPVRLLDALFLALLAITVAEAVPAVGALLVFALLITPAASVRRLVTRPYLALMLSAALALVITWAGLTMAFYLSYPVSFDISALGFVVYLLVLAFQQVRAMTRRRPDLSARGAQR